MVKIVIKKKEMLEIYATLQSLKNEKHTKFAYCILRNIKFIEPEIKILQELSKPDERYIEYTKKRLELCKKYGVKDDKGNLMLNVNKTDYLIEDSENFEKELNPINQEYQEIITTFENKQKEINKLIEEEDIEIPFYQITKDNLPANLTAVQLEKLNYYIKDEVL